MTLKSTSSNRINVRNYKVLFLYAESDAVVDKLFDLRNHSGILAIDLSSYAN